MAGKLGGLRPNLSEKAFFSHASIAKRIAEETRDQPCLKGNMFLSSDEFTKRCLEPAYKEQIAKTRSDFEATPAELEDGGAKAELGRLAVSQLIVPPVAIAFSLFFSLLSLIKLPGLLLSAVGVISPWPSRVLFVCGLVGVIAYPFAAEPPHSTIIAHLDEGGTVGTALRWVMAAEPPIFAIFN